MTSPTDPENNDVAKRLGLHQQASPFARTRPWLIWGLVGILLFSGLLYWKFGRSQNRITYQTQELQQGNLTVSVSATGTLQPTNQVDVGCETSGTIKSVAVDYNQRVTRGQVLALIDTARLEAQVRQTVASVEAARAKELQTRATVGETRAQLARLREVQKASNGRVPSRTDLDSAKAALERAVADDANAKAAVAQAEATLEAQRIDLAKAAIRSPINGIVLKRAVEPGQTVAASFQTPVLFTLAEDLTQMELHVDVDEADVGKVQGSQTATFTVSAYPDRSFPARVTQVRFGSKTVSGVVTYETVLKVVNKELLLRPGMTGTATITVQQANNVLLVPNTALRFTPTETTLAPAQQGGSLLSKLLPHPPRPATGPPATSDNRQAHVWVLQDDTLHKVAVTTGATNGIMTEVSATSLKPGMRVVVDMVDTQKPS